MRTLFTTALSQSGSLPGKSCATLLLLALTFSLATPQASFAAAPAKAGPPPLVSVITVTEHPVNPLTEYVGHVEALQSVDLQARVSGLLEEVRFQEGSDIKAGKLLYQIEAAPYQMKVAINQARLSKALSKENQAALHLQRIRSVRTGGIPASDIEAAEALAAQAQAEREEAEAVLKLSQLDLEYTHIAAPISGRIGATALTSGNLVGPSSGTLTRIVQLDPIRVLFSISENDSAAIRAAQNTATSKNGKALLQPRIKLPDNSFLSNPGQIDFVDNRVDPATGSIAVRARFENPQGLLLPGQYVSLVLGQEQSRALPVVPQAAVLEDREGRYVMVVDAQSQVVQRRLSMAATIGSLWAVESGLSAGEQVIVQGLQKVRPGQTVKTVAADASQGN